MTCGGGGGVWCICLGWHAAVAGMLLQSQLQVIGSSVVYLSLLRRSWRHSLLCLPELAERSLDGQGDVVAHH